MKLERAGWTVELELAPALVQGVGSTAQEQCLELAIACGEAAAQRAEALDVAGFPAWLKGSPLRGKARWRHALRRYGLRRPLPRQQEFHNLSWLRTRLFQAAEPLACAAVWRAGLPRYQYLITRRVQPAAELERVLVRNSEPVRVALLAELAREVARMHGLRFVHHDLFVRNFMVLPEGERRRLVFLDAWRGGPSPQLRGATYDLACIEPDLRRLVSSTEVEGFFHAYRRERAVLE